MKLAHTLTYDAPLAEVSAMLDDPAFREAVIEEQHGIDGSVTIEQQGETLVVELSQGQRTDRVPAAARKLIGDQLRIVQREEWTTAEYADLQITIPGAPGRVTGSVELIEDGDRTLQAVEVEISVQMPLVGGKLEQMIGDLLARALRAEERAGRRYLSR